MSKQFLIPHCFGRLCNTIALARFRSLLFIFIVSLFVHVSESPAQIYVLDRTEDLGTSLSRFTPEGQVEPLGSWEGVPTGVAAEPSGTVLVSLFKPVSPDSPDLTGEIHRVDPSSRRSTKITENQYARIEAITVSDDGSIFVLDRNSDLGAGLSRLTPGGRAEPLGSWEGVPTGVAVEPSGTILVSLFKPTSSGLIGEIHRVNITNRQSTKITVNQYARIEAIAVSDDGSVFVLDRTSNLGTSLSRLTPNGQVEPLGSWEGVPTGLAVEPSGTVLVSLFKPVSSDSSDLIGEIQRVNVGSRQSTKITATQYARIEALAAVRAQIQVPQRMLAPVVLSGGGFSIVFGNFDGTPMNGADPEKFELWASTNLSTWFFLDRPRAVSNGLFRIDDIDLINPQKFYRIITR